MVRMPSRRVVIVGGGLAGLFAARSLGSSDVAVTLVDRAQRRLFQPLRYQVAATGILSERQIAAPLRDILKRQRSVECVLAEVVEVDALSSRVIAQRPGGERIELPYDHLSVAAAVLRSDHRHDEFVRWPGAMKEAVADALAIRRKVFGAFEMAEAAADPDERRSWLTFAVVGAGPAGVELAGQIRELATRTLHAEFRHLRPKDARVLLFDDGSRPLASFGPGLSRKAAESLQALGVEAHTGSIVIEGNGGGVQVRDGTGRTIRLPARTVIWAARAGAPPVADAVATAAGAERDRAGRVRVGTDLTIPGHPEISVVGDLMRHGKPPGMAEAAVH
jgi:NADH:ubiquinone reductase (H+-translocating)